MAVLTSQAVLVARLCGFDAGVGEVLVERRCVVAKTYDFLDSQEFLGNLRSQKRRR